MDEMGSTDVLLEPVSESKPGFSLKATINMAFSHPNKDIGAGCSWGALCSCADEEGCEWLGNELADDKFPLSISWSQYCSQSTSDTQVKVRATRLKKTVTACELLEWFLLMNGTEATSKRSNKGEAAERMVLAVQEWVNSQEDAIMELTMQSPKFDPFGDPLRSMPEQRLNATETIGVFSTPALPMCFPTTDALWIRRVTGPVQWKSGKGTSGYAGGKRNGVSLISEQNLFQK